MAEPFLDILRDEFAANEGSFLMELRGELTWNKQSFSRMTTAMEECCKACNGRENLERWQAQAFWFIPLFVKQWTSHPNFPRPEPEQYYEKALNRLHDLAFWYFFGASSHDGGSGFDPL
jgi:hypothetical protein